MKWFLVLLPQAGPGHVPSIPHPRQRLGASLRRGRWEKPDGFATPPTSERQRPPARGPARPQPARPPTTGLQAAVPRGRAPPPHWLLPRQRLRGGQSPRGLPLGPLGRRWAGPTPGGAGPAPGGAGPWGSRAPFNPRARVVAVASLRPLPSHPIPSSSRRCAPRRRGLGSARLTWVRCRP